MTDRLDALYPEHIATVKRRHDAALAATGFDAVVIFSGAIHIAFLDDEMYPFKANPHFKSWVPVTNNPHCFVVYKPGDTPRLVFFQPVDYWYKPPDTPSGAPRKAARRAKTSMCRASSAAWTASTCNTSRKCGWILPRNRAGTISATCSFSTR